MYTCISIYIIWLYLTVVLKVKKKQQINSTFYFFISFNIVINPDIEINFVIGEKV